MPFTFWTRTIPLGAAAIATAVIYISHGRGGAGTSDLIALLEREVTLGGAPTAPDSPAELTLPHDSAAGGPAPDLKVATAGPASAAQGCSMPAPEGVPDVAADLEPDVKPDVDPAKARDMAQIVAHLPPGATSPPPGLIIALAPAPEATPPQRDPADPAKAPAFALSYAQPDRARIEGLLRARQLLLRVDLADGRQLRFVPGAQATGFWSGGTFERDTAAKTVTRLSAAPGLIPVTQLRARLLALRLGAAVSDVALLVAPDETRRIDAEVGRALARLTIAPGPTVRAFGCWRPGGFALRDLTVNGTRHAIAPDLCPPAGSARP